jgi:hypothetical protein
MACVMGISVMALGTVMGGCGTSTTRAQSAPCDRAVSEAPSSRISLSAAAILRATIGVVSATSPSPKCLVLVAGADVQLSVGDRVEFVANGKPQLDPPATQTVQVSISPGPNETGPGAPGGLATPHVIVTLMAVHTGRVSVRWFNCSGTGC